MRVGYRDEFELQKTGRYINKNGRRMEDERYLTMPRPPFYQSPNSETSMDSDGGMIGSLLGGVFCFLLFLLIIFCIAYPFTMYRQNPNYSSYPDDKWWCYHCLQSWCASKCWYDNHY